MIDARRLRAWIPEALLLLAGAVVYGPAIRAQYFLDDYVQSSMIRGTFPAPRSPINLYDFINVPDRGLLLGRGMLPWWADPRLTIRFFRPLSSALLWADHTLFGERPLLLHLHSLLWWAAAVLGARALFRRLLPARPANLATVIFALAPCHTFPLAWLANREALVSLAFGVRALDVYARWRDGRLFRDGAAATALFALSMLGGEYALCFAGYVVAFELWSRRDRLSARALGVLPFVVPAAAYRAVRGVLGYGARGSGFYTDPLREPAAYLAWAPRRVATLLLDGWFALDNTTFFMETPWWHVVLAVAAALALVALPIRGALARLDDRSRRTAHWLFLGSILAMGPVTAVISSPRVLGASMVGIAATVARLLDEVWFPPAPAAGVRSRAREHAALAATALGFAHLIHGPATSWLMARGFRQEAERFAVNSGALQRSLPDTGDVDVMILRGLAGSFFLPWLDAPGAAHVNWRILSQTGHVLALRVDARTLELVAPPSQSIFPPLSSANLFRNEQHKVAVGEVFDVPGLRATILEIGTDGPRRVRFEFDRDIESSTLRWVSEDRTGAFPESPPPKEGFGKPFDP